jgi:PKD repeat protein
MPTNGGSRLLRPPFAALSVAGLVVATVFASVATLATKPAAQQGFPTPSLPGQTTTTTTGKPVAIVPPENSAAGVVTTTTTPRTSTTTPTTTAPKPPTTTSGPVRRRPPVGDFIANCSGLSCTFDGTRSTDADGTIIYYAWSFGREEGGLERSNRSTVSHGYRTPGMYTVTLLVMDDDGITDTISRRIPVGA